MTRKIIFTFLAFTLALGILAFYQTNVTYAAGVYPAPTTKHVTSMTPLNATTCLNSPSKANCDNQDPYNNTGVQTNGCGVDAKVIAFKNFSTGYVEIMWSQNCQSNWTVLGVYGGTAPLDAWIMRYDGNGRYSGFEYQGTGSYIWTNMVYASTQLTCASGQINPPYSLVGVVSQPGYPEVHGLC